MIDAALRQQLPEEGGQDVAHEVIRILSTNPEHAVLIPSIEERVVSGEKKYGKRLQTNNKRNVDLDIYQEVLDAMNYSMQAFLQTGNHFYISIFNAQVGIAVQLFSVLREQSEAATA